MHRRTSSKGSGSYLLDGTASWVSKALRFDLYAGPREEYRRRTVHGAAATIIATAVAAVLFWRELAFSYQVEVEDTLYVSSGIGGGGFGSYSGQRLNISFDVSFPAVACVDVAVSLEDVSGEAQLGATHHVTKTPLHASGDLVVKAVKKVTALGGTLRNEHEIVGFKTAEEMRRGLSEEKADPSGHKPPDSKGATLAADAEPHADSAAAAAVAGQGRVAGNAATEVLKGAWKEEEIAPSDWGKTDAGETDAGAGADADVVELGGDGGWHEEHGSGGRWHDHDEHTKNTESNLGSSGHAGAAAGIGGAGGWLVNEENDDGGAEGCRLTGYVEAANSAGNVHFAAARNWQMDAAFEGLRQMGMGGHAVMLEMLASAYDIFNSTHIIHRLRFGESSPGAHYPLDGQRRMVVAKGDAFHYQYQYYLKVVPTVHRWLDGTEQASHQYAVTEHARRVGPGGGRGLPGLYWHYELSPVHAMVEEKRRGLMPLLTSACAIVGGVYTLVGLMNAAVGRISAAGKKKS